MIEGHDLVSICLQPGMPHRATVYRWASGDPEFATRIARAREGLAEYFEHRIGVEAEACTPENARAVHVKIGALQWRAAKLAPKKYGDKIAQELSGPDGGPIRTQPEPLSDLEAARRIAFLLARGQKLLEQESVEPEALGCPESIGSATT